MIGRDARHNGTDRWVAFMAAVLCSTILIIGCDEKPSDRQETDSTTQAAADDSAVRGAPVDTTPTTTPSGRIELPTINTAAPSLFVTLPDGYAVRNDTGLDDDVLFIYRADDPLVMGDSTSIPKGILRIIIGDTSVTMKAPGTSMGPHRSMVGSYPLEWRRTSETIGARGTYVSYDGEIPSYFARYGDDEKLSRLNLHLYVGGSDTAIVNELLTILSTLSPRQ